MGGKRLGESSREWEEGGRDFSRRGPNNTTYENNLISLVFSSTPIYKRAANCHYRKFGVICICMGTVKYQYSKIFHRKRVGVLFYLTLPSSSPYLYARQLSI